MWARARALHRGTHIEASRKLLQQLYTPLRMLKTLLQTGMMVWDLYASRNWNRKPPEAHTLDIKKKPQPPNAGQQRHASPNHTVPCATKAQTRQHGIQCHGRDRESRSAHTTETEAPGRPPVAPNQDHTLQRQRDGTAQGKNECPHAHTYPPEEASLSAAERNPSAGTHGAEGGSCGRPGRG